MKTANIFLTKRGYAKVLDFGLDIAVDNAFGGGGVECVSDFDAGLQQPVQFQGTTNRDKGGSRCLYPLRYCGTGANES